MNNSIYDQSLQISESSIFAGTWKFKFNNNTTITAYPYLKSYNDKEIHILGHKYYIPTQYNDELINIIYDFLYFGTPKTLVK